MEMDVATLAARAGRDDLFDRNGIRPHGPPDGTGGPPATATAKPGAPKPGAANATPKTGPLLTESDRAIFELIHEDVVALEPHASNQWEEIKRNRAWRMGKRWQQLVSKHVENRAVLKYVDRSAGFDANLPNKIDDLSRKIVATVTSDEPQPQAEPRSAADEDVQSAEFAERILVAECDANRLNVAERIRDALDLSITDKSAFLYLRVEPTAGGYRPKEIEAAPLATDPQQPTMVPAPPPTDATGAPIPVPSVGPDGRPLPPPMMPYAGPLVSRLVDEGVTTFVESPAAAGRQWLPGFVLEIVPVGRVRLHPPTSASVADATAVTLLLFSTLGELERRFPKTVGRLSDADAQRVCAWTPLRANELLPDALRVLSGMGATKGGRPRPDTLVWYYARYEASTTDYPDGCFVYAGGEGVFVEKGENAAMVPLPDDTERKDCLDIPVVQIRPKPDLLTGDWSGDGLIGMFAPGDEYRAQIMGGLLEASDINLHLASFMSATSVAGARNDTIQHSRDTGVPIKVQSVRDDKPEFEPAREMPQMALQLFKLVSDEMNVAASLGATAQGLETTDVNSGIQAQVTVEQAKTGLGGAFTAWRNGYARLLTLMVQQARARFLVAQRVRYVGDDGAAKEENFRGSDFHGVADVKVKPGTGSMMGPSAKQQYVANLRMMFPGQLNEADAYEIVLSGVSGQIGAADNPHRQRVLRQINQWKQGPPEGWAPMPPPPPAMPPMPMPPDMMGGAPMGGPPMPAAGMAPPMAPPLPPGPPPRDPSSPFDARPVDTQIDVATIRLRELGQTMAGTAFDRQPAPWQAVLIASYMESAQAITPPPAASNAPSAPKPSAPPGRPTGSLPPSPTPPPSDGVQPPMV